MAKQNVGDVRVSRPGAPQQGHGILHRGEPAPVEVALNAPAVYRLAVAHVILGNHHNSLLIEKIGEVIVALDIFRNAVDDLYHGFCFALGQPVAAVDFSRALGIVPEIFPHISPPLRSPRR